MKKLLRTTLQHSIFALLVAVACLTNNSYVHASEDDATDSTSEKFISFRYTDEDLVDVVNAIAAIKMANVILPVGPNAINARVTIDIGEKLSLTQAWDMLYTVLDVAGYSMTERKNNTFAIIRTNRDIIKAALPVYIGVDPEKLPNTDERIRFLYFLSNVRVSEEAEGELQNLLKELLPQGESNYKVEPATNSLMITAKSKDIRAIMHIVRLLEETTFKEKMEILKLQNVAASTVANLFNETILRSPLERQRYGADTRKPVEATYFSKYVKVVAEDRINALIIVGREQAVDRIIDFIHKHIDVSIETGQSILHVYQLQYLDSAEFAPVLKRIVESAQAGGTGQARVETTPQAGVERYFEGVIVQADSVADEANEGKSKGSNKLVIAARNHDWRRIRDLIAELDVPQPQVIIQVLVADLRLDDIRLIGSLIRNAAKLGLPQGANFQAANIGNIVVDDIDKPTTIAADLLRKYYNEAGNVASSKAGAVQSFAALTSNARSTFVSLNDCTNCWTWALLQLLNTMNYTKVISLPHVIAVNNKKAQVIIGEERFVKDESVGNQGGSVTATKKWVDANLVIDLKPHIAYGAEAENLSLDITVDINDFENTVLSDADRVTRHVETTALLKDGGLLVLGGLMKFQDINSISQTPILGQIPILGYFFKQRRRQTPKTGLTVFIMPTIIHPKFRGGMGEYTQDYIKLTKNYTQEGMLFDSLKDPITRWFFAPESHVAESVDSFVGKTAVEDSSAYQGTLVADAKPAETKKTDHRRKSRRTRRRKQASRANSEGDDLRALLSGQENPLA